MQDIVTASLLFASLDKEDKEPKVLGVVAGIKVVGTKFLRVLDADNYIYGSWVYSSWDLPLVYSLDLDELRIEPICSALEWFSRAKGTIPIKSSLVAADDKRAVLITNEQECKDVDWQKEIK